MYKTAIRDCRLRRLEIETRAPLKVARSVAVVSRISGSLFADVPCGRFFFRVFSFFLPLPPQKIVKLTKRPGAAASEVSTVTFYTATVDNIFYTGTFEGLYRPVNVYAAIKRVVSHLSLKGLSCEVLSLTRITHAIRARRPLTILFSCKLRGLRHEAPHSEFYDGNVSWCVPFLYFFGGKKGRQVRPETPQRRGRLISWLNITGGKKVFVFFSHSDWSTRSTLRSTTAGHSSFFSGSLVSRERSKSHFPLSQTVHFFLKRDFWACKSDFLVLKV